MINHLTRIYAEAAEQKAESSEHAAASHAAEQVEQQHLSNLSATSVADRNDDRITANSLAMRLTENVVWKLESQGFTKGGFIQPSLWKLRELLAEQFAEWPTPVELRKSFEDADELSDNEIFDLYRYIKSMPAAHPAAGS